MRSYILHDTDGLLSLANKLILSLLNLGSRLFTDVVVHGRLWSLTRQSESRTLCIGLGRIQAQPRVLHCLASTCGKLDVGVEGGTPAGQEAALDLGVLRQSRLTNLLAGNGVLLESGSKGVLTRACLLGCEHVRRVEGGAGNGMVERLGLGLCRGGSSEGSLGFGGRGGAGEEVHLLRDGASEVVEGFADIGWVVVGFVGVL